MKVHLQANLIYIVLQRKSLSDIKYMTKNISGKQQYLKMYNKVESNIKRRFIIQRTSLPALIRRSSIVALRVPVPDDLHSRTLPFFLRSSLELLVRQERVLQDQRV